jgi:hypothetical protein
MTEPPPEPWLLLPLTVVSIEREGHPLRGGALCCGLLPPPFLAALPAAQLAGVCGFLIGFSWVICLAVILVCACVFLLGGGREGGKGSLREFEFPQTKN